MGTEKIPIIIIYYILAKCPKFTGTLVFVLQL